MRRWLLIAFWTVSADEKATEIKQDNHEGKWWNEPPTYPEHSPSLLDFRVVPHKACDDAQPTSSVKAGITVGPAGRGARDVPSASLPSGQAPVQESSFGRRSIAPKDGVQRVRSPTSMVQQIPSNTVREDAKATVDGILEHRYGCVDNSREELSMALEKVVAARAQLAQVHEIAVGELSQARDAIDMWLVNLSASQLDVLPAFNKSDGTSFTEVESTMKDASVAREHLRAELSNAMEEFAEARRMEAEAKVIARRARQNVYKLVDGVEGALRFGNREGREATSVGDAVHGATAP
eukprot:TRINITY_DN18008_c0_g1_i1.p1 TRINITY_DN18008_c0_g1~~TRINITY_DN18008_c0_g1_i1.p1  ORF type:complete len:294 (+),score=55.10 TRINITY_DN18008_c0_g1_i1:130-1011(+)